MKRLAWLTIVLAAVTVTFCSCGISLQSLPKIGGVSGPTYPVTATFANVVNLPANAQVRVGAFQVGYVSAINVKDFQAVVTMRVKKSTRLPVGTSAAIHFDTPLGEDFVLLQPPALPSANAVLTSGASIPESDTTTAPNVEDLFGALGTLLNDGGINQLQTIISQTDAAFNGNTSKIRSLIQYLNTTVTSFAQNTPAIDRSLQAMAALSRTLNQGSSTIVQGIKGLGPAVDFLSSETGDLNTLLQQLHNLSNAANTIIDASASGTVQTVQALQPLLVQLTNVQQQIAPALTAITQLEQYTPRAIPGDYLQLSIKATIDVPPLPADAPPLQKITVDPPDPAYATTTNAISVLIEGGLP